MLGIAQSTISELISKLEQKMGVNLIIRGARGVELTDAGTLLAEQGETLLMMLHDLSDNVQSLGSEPAGHVSLGLPSSLGMKLAVPLAETIFNEMPTLKLHITEAMSRSILERIERDELHMGCVFDVPDPAIFIAEPIFTEELFVVTAPDNWPDKFGPNGLAKKKISMKRLSELPLVLPRQSHGARTLIARYAHNNHVRLNVVMEIDALWHLIELTARASAYTILPQIGIVDHIKNGKLSIIRVNGPKMERTAYLVRKRNRPRTQAMTEVEKNMRQILKEIVSRYRLSARMIE